MHKVQSNGATISYTKVGSGPTLVLVHGGFSDHHNFWQLASPGLEKHFSVVAIARRGHGESTKTLDHNVDDEGRDICAVIDDVGGDVYVLAHSSGSFCALVAAMASPRVKKLILYEPPGSTFVPEASMARIKEAAARGDWEQVVEAFLGELAAMIKPTPLFAQMVDNAEVTMPELRNIPAYGGDPQRFTGLNLPVLLMQGSETGDDRLEVGTLSRVLPNSRVVVLEGQGHAAMLTAPGLFVQEVEKFLLEK